MYPEQSERLAMLPQVLAAGVVFALVWLFCRLLWRLPRVRAVRHIGEFLLPIFGAVGFFCFLLRRADGQMRWFYLPIATLGFLACYRLLNTPFLLLERGVRGMLSLLFMPLRAGARFFGKIIKRITSFLQNILKKLFIFIKRYIIIIFTNIKRRLPRGKQKENRKEKDGVSRYSH